MDGYQIINGKGLNFKIASVQESSSDQQKSPLPPNLINKKGSDNKFVSNTAKHK
jgi:hypothetical protein